MKKYSIKEKMMHTETDKLSEGTDDWSGFVS